MSDTTQSLSSNDAKLSLAATFDTSSSSSYCIDDVETGTAVVDNVANVVHLSTQKQSLPSPTTTTKTQRDCKSKNKKLIGMIVVGVIVALSMFFIGLSVGRSTNDDARVPNVTTEEESTEVEEDTTLQLGPTVPENDEDTELPQDEDELPLEFEEPVYVFNTTTTSPSMSPTPGPSSSPTTASPTQSPTTAPPTSAPTPANPYFFGDEFITREDLGIQMSAGLNVKLIAKTGDKVQYANGGESNDRWHTRSDAAGIVPLDPENPLEGGYVYMSNSESDDEGGVYGLYFDKDGNIVDYKALLTGTRYNCGGGLTPWNTWVSCEEDGDDGQCWQVDPVNMKAEETKLGGDGGNYESVACDDRVYDQPVFFTTEDEEDGALRRFVAQQHGWDALHSDGETSFLNILDDTTFEWTTNEKDGSKSAKKYFPKTEGIQVHEGKVYFMSKEFHRMIILDLENFTYTTESTGKKFYGEGSFGGQPDQIFLGPSRKYLYFTEDGSSDPGIYARYHDGTYFTMFQAIRGGIHTDDETIGIALSPDNKRFYAGFQDNGYIFEFTREDGLAFE